MIEETRHLLLTTLVVIALASCAPPPESLPDWPTPEPPPTPPPVAIPGWESVVLESVCIELEQSYNIATEPYVVDSELEDPLHIREMSEAFLADMGIKVSPDSSSCDGIIAISVEGETISGVYSGLGACHSGDRVDIQLTLTAGDLVVSSHQYSNSIGPPSAIARCVEPDTPATFRRVVRRPLFLALVYPWGPGAYGSALVNVFPQPDIAQEQLAVAIPFLIQSLNDEDEHVQEWAVRALEHIAAPAIEAVPYLVRYWEEHPHGPGRPKPALISIARACINCDLEEWKKWWRERP